MTPPPSLPLAPPAAPAVALEHVTFLHPGGRGVEDVSLSLPPGAILGLLGPNGAGKSTVLSLVAGFRLPAAGHARVLGEPISARLRRHMGILFQDSSLDPLMTVRETLWLQGRLFGLGGADLKSRIARLLALIDLQERAGDAIETLSGGLKRRLELARSILHRPALLLLDEPTLGLDPESRLRLWDLLLQINADDGAALLVATNDVAEAERYCQHVAFIDHGRLVAKGTPTDLKRDLKRDSVHVEWPQPPPDIADAIGGWPGVGRVTLAPPILHVTVDNAAAFVPKLFTLAGDGIRALRIHESTLEDAYFEIVGSPFAANGAGEERP